MPNIWTILEMPKHFGHFGRHYGQNWNSDWTGFEKDPNLTPLVNMVSGPWPRLKSTLDLGRSCPSKWFVSARQTHRHPFCICISIWSKIIDKKILAELIWPFEGVIDKMLNRGHCLWFSHWWHHLFLNSEHICSWTVCPCMFLRKRKQKTMEFKETMETI